MSKRVERQEHDQAAAITPSSAQPVGTSVKQEQSSPISARGKKRQPAPGGTSMDMSGQSSIAQGSTGGEEPGIGDMSTMGPPAKKSRTNTPWTPAEEQRLKTMRDDGNSWAEIAKVKSRQQG